MDKIAGIQRNCKDGGSSNIRFDVAGGGLQPRRIVGYLDGLLAPSNTHWQVNRNRLTHDRGNSGSRQVLETNGRSIDLIQTGIQV